MGANPKNQKRHTQTFIIIRNILTPPGPGTPIPRRVATGLPIAFPRGGFPIRLISLGGATRFGRTGGRARRINRRRRLSHLRRLRGRRKTRWRRRVGRGPRARAALIFQSQSGSRRFRGITRSRGRLLHMIGVLRIQGGREHHQMLSRNPIPRRWQGAI